MFVNKQFFWGRERYRRSAIKGRLTDYWGKITGQPTELVRFADVAQPLRIHQPLNRRLQVVRFDCIVGSVGRVGDFTRTFLPRSRVNQDRWAQLDAAYNSMIALPPVDLYQIGTVYFVRDGHHRISVARANGQFDIEADVIELQSPIALQVADFQNDRWQQIIQQVAFAKENSMLDQNFITLAEGIHEQRIKEALHQHRFGSRSGIDFALPQRWITRLGERLIALGLKPKGQEMINLPAESHTS